MMKRVVCSVLNLFVIMLHTQLVSSQLPSDQVSAMASVYEIVQNNTSPSFVWNGVLKASNPCSWRGVGCTPDNSSISTISFESLSISTSEFLPFLCNIDTLESLDVSGNHLTSIPDGFFTFCGGLSGLKLLNFSGNNLIGTLPSFNNRFRMLEKLDLSHNSLSGEISLQLDGLDSLKILNLDSNQFIGKIPTNLGEMNLLEKLLLSSNNFTGKIPKEISRYKNLRVIDFSNNKLSGSIPREFGELTMLQTLVLSSNSLSGGIPTWISNITTLQRFAANQNMFNGTIPLGITSFLSFLDLSYNSLSGIIPSDLLSGNLQSLDLSSNKLEGPTPSITSKNLFRLSLGSNSLYGTFPTHSLGIRSNLRYLELNNNRLSGEIPLELGMLRKLALLNLAKNRLRGTLPPSLCNLTNLEVLNLESNNLVGEIPPQISQLNRLWKLNMNQNSMSGSISWVSNLSSLIELQLGNNQLSGTLPDLPISLEIALNLSYNLFSGHLPFSLTKLGKLLVLDLSNNRLSGRVPVELNRLKSLTHLLLSNNKLSGSIPMYSYNVVVDITGNDNLIDPRDIPTEEPTPPPKTKSIDTGLVVAYACGFPVGLVISVIAIFISRRYKSIHHHLSPPSSILRSAIDLKRGIEAVSDPSNITHEARFSTFYKAIMPSGSTYLVKKISHSHNILKFPRNGELSEELQVLGNLSHPNVMIPKAYVLTPRRAYLFYDFARGTLHDVLHHRTGNATLGWSSRYSIAVGVAKGLAYLHECSSGPVLLLDLCTKSVLLKSLDEPQISDVELCKFIHPSRDTERVTAAGNVYSYGVLLLELLSGKPAVSDGGAELAEWALTLSEDKSQRGKILDSSIEETSVGVRRQMLGALEVALACVSISPEKRPNAVTVRRMLQRS